MVNTRLLEQAISDSGMTMVAIAKKSGISRETLYNKLRGVSEFKASEISNLSKVLRLSTGERDSIFFNSEMWIIFNKKQAEGGEDEEKIWRHDTGRAEKISG